MIAMPDHFRATSRFIEVGLGIFGVTVVLTPLALWVAWNEQMYYGILVVCVVAVGLFIGFAKLLSWLPGSVVDEDAAASARVYAERMRGFTGEDWDSIELDGAEASQGRHEYGNEVLRSIKLVFWAASVLLALGGGLLLGAYYLISAISPLP
jgi:hypothetical protein